MQKSKFRTVLGLVLLYVAVFFNWQWIWGLLFLIWVIPDLFSGMTYFIEPIERKENPILYWLIVASWLWMAIYTIATPFFPQLNGQSVQAAQPLKELGIYKDQPIQKTKTNQNLLTDLEDGQTSEKNISENEKNESPVISKDTLPYKAYNKEATTYYIGITADMNEHDPDLEKHTSELWEYFYNNDISEAISNIIDERIYFIFSKTDAEGNYKATIAYRTKDIKNIYEGLEGIAVPPTKFAVFEQTSGESEKFIADTWTKIYASNLNFKNSFNMEVYELDDKYEVKKAEIRIAID